MRRTDERTFVWQKAAAQPARQRVTQPPQRPRVDAQHHQMPFGTQHPVHLTQQLMGIGAVLQPMRHHHQIHRLAGKGQLAIVCHPQVGLPFALVHRPRALQHADAMRHAVVGQRIQCRHAQLHRVIAKDIAHGTGQLPPFPLQQVAAGRRGQPARPGVRIAFMIGSVRGWGRRPGTFVHAFPFTRRQREDQNPSRGTRILRMNVPRVGQVRGIPAEHP